MQGMVGADAGTLGFPFGSLQGTDTAPPGHEETSSLMTCRGPGQQDANKNPKRRQHSSTKSDRRLRSTLSRSVSRQHRIIDGFANNFPGSLQPAACATLICSEALGIREVGADRDKKLVKSCPVSRLCDHQNNVCFAKALVARLGCDQISGQEKVCGYGIKWRYASCAAAVFLLNFTYSDLRSPTFHFDTRRGPASSLPALAGPRSTGMMSVCGG